MIVQYAPLETVKHAKSRSTDDEVNIHAIGAKIKIAETSNAARGYARKQSIIVAMISLFFLSVLRR